MKKQIIIGILIFLAIAVIGAGAYYFGINQKADNQPKEINKNAWPKKLNCGDIEDIKAKENCLAGAAKLLNSDDNSVCAGLITEADKNTCRGAYIIKEAAESGDLNKCAAAADESLAADCSAQASFSLAIQKKDKKYCENIINKTDKENCFKVLAEMGVK